VTGNPRLVAADANQAFYTATIPAAVGWSRDL
jgi:hypothetical protein